MVMTWGQFLDHDLTLTEFTVGVNPQLDCGTSQEPCPSLIEKPFCFGVNISSRVRLSGDPLARCTPLVRSEQNSHGNQINEITAYLDGSQVYGSDLETAKSLRFFKLGLLIVEPFINSSDLPILPAQESVGGEAGFCRSNDTETQPCFRAGDPRVNENQALMAMHALWVREHNRIAKHLFTLNPSWKDEKLYQEARRIVGAMLQHITYNEWLPTLIPSQRLRRKAGVALEADGTFSNDYAPEINSTIINSFATAGLRIGHTLIRENFTVSSGVDLIDQLSQSPVDFFNPGPLNDPNLGVNPYTGLYLGLAGIRAGEFDRNIADAVRERLIIPGPDGGFFGDLAAINMQRGRDHGLPGYIQFSTLCGGPVARGYNFNGLKNILSSQRRRLARAYKTVEDIDLFAGLLSERNLRGSELGLTTTCLMLAQFSRTRRGDRFWYERNDTLTGFTIEQLTEIRKASLARVICDNSDDVTTIQPEVFKRSIIHSPNDDVPCRHLPFVNLNVFKESAKYSGAPKFSRSGGFGGNVAA
ncbi:peroxidasin homolog [Orbicella faveolata]|uniref:peroxidasin homolog n=1 Tax=Orbicella faveolata TaxID=48498 RepID=UPI0009E213CD|nr:peroxidasin homolog [Orbicella faveolata]